MILAVDQGTTGTTCLVLDAELRVHGRGYRPIRQYFPHPGWVEHDPEELWTSVLDAAEGALREAGIAAEAHQALGLANQRETTLLWQRSTGCPVAPAIVWRDRRTADRCRHLPADLIRARTGLVPDPYFSATKLEWLLARTDVAAGDLAFGTVDSWLLWKLTGGAVHATDRTNASRTLLASLDPLDWDPELLALVGVERELLPEIVPSSTVVAEGSLLGAIVPIAGVAGDQQASLFGHGCFGPGEVKATYGTGTFVLADVGRSLEAPPPGLLKTASASPGAPGYALEGSILTSGALVQWLRDGLGLIGDADEIEALARSVPSADGVVVVPALTGLGSPHWDPLARGLISGLTPGTTRAHLARAALEAIAFQVADVVDTLPGRPDILRADGGASTNAFLMQFQADVLGGRIEVAAERETTALGAAALAGLAVGVWSDQEELRALIRSGAAYEPRLDAAAASRRREEWALAVRRARLR